MAHHPNNRRNFTNLAAPDPQISKPTTDLTGITRKKHPKSSTTTATTSAVYNLTNHFSRLNHQPNPKPTKTQNPQLVDSHTHLQARALAKSAHFEKPSASIQKVGKQGKRVVLENGNNVNNNKSLVVVEEKKVKQEKGNSNNGVMKLKPTTTTTSTKQVVIGKRRSFCDVQVELANFLVTNCAKVVSADMPPLMQIHAVGFARNTKDNLEKFTSKSLALSLKKEFDGVYGPAWHCIVGTSFGSFVTHSVGGFLYFSLDQKLYILIFKTTVQRAN